MERFRVGTTGAVCHWFGVFPRLIYDKLDLKGGRQVRLPGYSRGGVSGVLSSFRLRCSECFFEFALLTPKPSDFASEPEQLAQSFTAYGGQNAGPSELVGKHRYVGADPFDLLVQ
jgi:hypothetical protein